MVMSKALIKEWIPYIIINDLLTFFKGNIIT